MAQQEAFIKAIQYNERLIYKVAIFYTDSVDDRDDLVQEIVYALWKSFGSFQNRSTLSTWIYRVAMNVSIYHFKKGKKRISLAPINEEILNLPDERNIGDVEQMQLLQKHMAELNLLDKGILMLYLDDKAHEEIAQIIGITKSNVGTRLSRIKEKLKQQINKSQNDGIRRT